MIQNDDYIEFDLKALFFYILRQWKLVLAVILASAVLLGGFMAYSEYTDALKKNSIQAENQPSQWQVSVCETRIADTQNAISALQDYIDHSVLMKLDHRNINIAKAAYYVDSGYRILPENTFQNPDKNDALAWYYCNYFRDYRVFEEIGSEVGIEAKYLMELVSVESPNDFTVSISVSHPSSQTAAAIMQLLQERMQEVHLQLKEIISDHTLTLIQDSCGTYIEEELYELQQDAYDELEDLREALQEYEEELDALKKDGQTETPNLAAAFIKWFILGGAAGGVLIVVFLFMKSVLRNRLHAYSQLTSSFLATVLGEAVSGTELSPVIRKINRLEGCLSENSEENYQFVAENIKTHCGEARKILVCGDVDPSLSAAIAETLNKHLTGISLLPAGNPVKDADALRALCECDAVLMVAARDRSRNSAIKKMLKMAASCQKETIGFIMTY